MPALALTTLAFAFPAWATNVLMVVFLLISVIMVLSVLIQRPQGGGLSGAFGSGAGSGQTAFGTKTGDALTIFTIIIFTVFIGLAIALNYATRPLPAGEPAIQAVPGTNAPAGAAPATPAPGETPASGQAPVPGPVPGAAPGGDVPPAGVLPSESTPGAAPSAPVPSPEPVPAPANPAPSTGG